MVVNKQTASKIHWRWLEPQAQLPTLLVPSDGVRTLALPHGYYTPWIFLIRFQGKLPWQVSQHFLLPFGNNYHPLTIPAMGWSIYSTDKQHLYSFTHTHLIFSQETRAVLSNAETHIYECLVKCTFLPYTSWWKASTVYHIPSWINNLKPYETSSRKYQLKMYSNNFLSSNLSSSRKKKSILASQ